jgi:PAS domain S-box-containing protein
MDAIVAVDADQRIVLWNASAERMFACKAADALGSQLDRFVPERFRRAHRQHVEHFGETGMTARRMGRLGELRGLRATGEEFPIEVSISRVEGRRGTLFTAIVRDVSERARFAEQLARQTAIIDQLNESVIATDLEGHVFFWNQGAERAFGLSRADTLGRDVREVLAETSVDPAVVPQVSEAVRERGHHEMESSFVSRSGHSEWHRTTFSPFRDVEGRPAGVIAVTQDITQRRRAEQRERELGRILEDSLNEIYVFDAESLRFVQVNRGARLNVGYDMEELRELTPIDLEPELDAEGFERLLAPLRSGAKLRAEYHTVHRRKDGTLYPVTVHLQPGRYEGSSVFVAVVLDTSERQRSLEARLEAEGRVREAAALAEVGTLMAGIAHDVGTPMNVILGYSQMLEGSLSEPRDRERVRIISEQVRRVTKLIETVLNLARPRRLRHSVVDLSGVLDQSLAFFRERLQRHGIEVERGYEPAPAIHGDRDRLQQLFLNLFVNAADAMPDGGLLTVRLAPRAADEVEVRVHDTGVGIPPDQIDRIFEPFFTTKPRGRGTGLGLVVSRGIVLDHGGSIAASSSEGRGTEFRICLPVNGASRRGSEGDDAPG